LVNDESEVCKRPYDLGKRAAAMDRNRTAVLEAARAELEENGWANFTMDVLARKSKLTRQTVHNLFGSKTAILEALFDQLAGHGGLSQIAELMRGKDNDELLRGFVGVFCGFWARDRILIRRIHAIATIEPELGAVVHARNERRQGLSKRIFDRIDPNATELRRKEVTGLLYALTAFEFFDVLLDGGLDAREASDLIVRTAQAAVQTFGR
jgi:AcrR family transcriptional regulator